MDKIDLVKVYLPSHIIQNSKTNTLIKLYGNYQIEIRNNKQVICFFVNKFNEKKESTKEPLIGSFINLEKTEIIREPCLKKKLEKKSDLFLRMEIIEKKKFNCEISCSNFDLDQNTIKYLIFLYDPTSLFINEKRIFFSKSSNEMTFDEQSSIANIIQMKINKLNTKKWMLFKIDFSRFLQSLVLSILILTHCLFYEKNILRKRARLYSLGFNFFIGFVISLFICLNPYVDVLSWLDCLVFNYMELLMYILTEIINWLMGVPVGLKLNKPLNEFLGRFFLYHIYLWNSTLELFRYTLPFLLLSIIYSGFLGLSFLLSMFLDVIKILTIHNYCFYVYALRIYKFEMESLKSLFRLFRGKKLNPLRSRIDSYSFNMDQLFIGTLGFCIAFFLFPTVIMYYVVFLSLRIFLVFIYLLINFSILFISNIPIYELTVYFFKSKFISDKLNYSVNIEFQQQNNYSIFNLKTTKIDFKKLLKITECQIPSIKFSNYLFSNIINGEKI